jgi:hypothetical protein
LDPFSFRQAQRPVEPVARVSDDLIARGVSQCQSGSSLRESTWIRRADAFPAMRSQPALVLVWATAISKLSGGNHRA